MRTERIAAALAGALLLAGCTGSPAATTIAVDASGAPNAAAVALPGELDALVAAAVERLPGLIEQALADSGVPGLAVAVVSGGETVYSAGFGVRELGRPEAVDADTVFQIASVSKSLTGTAIARLVSDGVLDWDTPVHELLPDLVLSDPYVTEHATIADFMSHRSGLRTGAGDELEMLGYDRDTILGRLARQPLDAFRSSYHYSNFGITIAGEAAAAAAGLPWEELVERELFAPLGMTSTSARHEDYLAAADRAAIHARIDGRFEARFQRDADAEAPAGGVSSTANDLATWMRLVLAGGEHDGEALIAPEALTPAITPQQVSGHPGAPIDRAGFYGYGFNVSDGTSGRTTIGHSGAFILGTGTNFRMIPALGIGIVVLTNGAPVGVAEGIANDFTELVELGTLTRDWVGAYADALAEDLAPTGDLLGAARPAADPPALDDYVGTYESDYLGRAVVERDGDGLVVRMGPDGAFAVELDPWDGDEFASTATGEEAPAGSVYSATFRRVDGAVAGLTLALFDEQGLGTLERVS